MKKLLLLLLATSLFIACDKADDLIMIQAPQSIIPVPELHNPDVILNDIATGKISGPKMARIYFENYNDTPYRIYIEYVGDDTDRIKKLTYINPNYTCEVTTLTFTYRIADEFIDKVALNTVNTCLEYEVNKIFNYNYEHGVLKSIKMDNDAFFENVYFSYNPDGTVAILYRDSRPKSDPTFYGYQKFIYTYDANKNVTSYVREDFSSNQYDQKYTFTYDNTTNPFRGFYISSSVRKPSLGFSSSAGPFFLSRNNIASVKEEYVNIEAIPVMEYFDVTLYQNKIVDYGNDGANQYWFRYYLQY
jgi:hypothetical protein